MWSCPLAVLWGLMWFWWGNGCCWGKGEPDFCFSHLCPPRKELCNLLHLAWFGPALDLFVLHMLMSTTAVMATKTHCRGGTAKISAKVNFCLLFFTQWKGFLPVRLFQFPIQIKLPWGVWVLLCFWHSSLENSWELYNFAALVFFPNSLEEIWFLGVSNTQTEVFVVHIVADLRLCIHGLHCLSFSLFECLWTLEGV